MGRETKAYPALHNAMWPGLVGKGPDSEPPIDLETMLKLTAAAEVDDVRFDGVGFSGGRIDFGYARFLGGQVLFTQVEGEDSQEVVARHDRDAGE